MNDSVKYASQSEVTREELFKELNDAFQRADYEAQKRMSVAKTTALIDQPFFGALLMQLKSQPTMAIPTLATDGVNIFYNPFYVNELPRNMLPTAIAHEAMHVALDHIARRGNRSMDRWNRAADYVINPLLKSSGMPLSSDWLYHPKYQGKNAEEVYSVLPGEGPDDGTQSTHGNGTGHGRHCHGILPPAPAEEVPEHMKPENMVAAAATAAKCCGGMPAELEELVDAIINPKLPWEKLLRNFVCANTKTRFSWTKPNRRYLPTYLPSSKGKGIGECAIVFDTSGSISPQEAEAFTSEMSSILQDTQPEMIHFLQVDAAVQKYEQLTHHDLPLKVTIKGRGGTAFNPAFEFVKEQCIHPKFLIYMTDGYPYDKITEVPDYPVMWVTTGATDFANFGEVLELDVS